MENDNMSDHPAARLLGHCEKLQHKYFSTIESLPYFLSRMITLTFKFFLLYFAPMLIMCIKEFYLWNKKMEQVC